MTNEELKTKVLELYPATTFEDGTEWLTAVIEPFTWKEIAPKIRSTAGLDFDFLFCITCVDWKTHFTMVYHLRSTIHQHIFVVKAKLDHINPEIHTVSGIWRTAEFHEREAYDLFGVKFLDHPDLRRLFMTDDWNGWPVFSGLVGKGRRGRKR